MNRRPVRLSLIAALACAALLSVGCGNKEAVVTHAETEGIYLDVGPLDYQLQLSRVLNPGIVPDKEYFRGLPDGEAELAPNEAWFGIFIRVQNQTDEAHESAEEFEIVDTQENVYTPVPFLEGSNAIAYTARELQPSEEIPAIDSIAADGPTQGALLLFRMPFSTLQNRPLEFKIKADGAEATVDIDV